MLSVRPRPRACWLSTVVSASPSVKFIFSDATGTRLGAGAATSVGSSRPDNAALQAATAAVRSCAAIQAR